VQAFGCQRRATPAAGGLSGCLAVEPNDAWEKIRTFELVSLARGNKKEKKDRLYEVV
jgi:hypothetical protein